MGTLALLRGHDALQPAPHGKPCAGSAAGAHLHQVWGHEAPTAHHMEQRPRLAPHNPQHGVSEPEEVEGALPVLGGFNFS